MRLVVLFPGRSQNRIASLEHLPLNPLGYLADVLVRVNTHPNSQIDELRPHVWNRSTVAAA